ncbi:translation factor GTPase family protein [uncultured Ruminococcus sp.]|uniref:translation factor GTPase family protein n=1 Tax=uncultured Ruminococcus sp. TaxID=165186 RepID=UPI00292D9456|nr:translation factor GTPase family protein [uncultured Ruminococcus sp.]
MKQITVGMLAHVDSGKTTLTEAMLYLSGALSKLGRVDHKNSFLDNFQLERDRGITIFSKMAVFTTPNARYTILDTPGHVDFSAETERALQVLDYAILVISGTDGVQSHTTTLWKLLQKYRVPCFLFVNKMDMDGADKSRVLNEIKSKLSDSAVDFTAERNELYENIALCDEKLLESYYETETVGHDDIVRVIRERRLYPVLFGSALKLSGVEELLQALDAYTVMPRCGDDFAAKVYKISEDNQGNRLTFMKITGGSLRVKDIPASRKNTAGEKVNQIRLYSGEKFTVADTAESGTVCAVTGLSFTSPGDGLGTESDSGLPVLEPVLTYSVILPDTVDVHTALAKLRILEAEDPTLHVSLNERSGDIQLQLMGEIQLEILQSLIPERFGFRVGFGQGSIIYKETIRNTVEGVGHFEPLRHYAEVHLLLKPAERDSGLLFKSECKEDELDKNWQRLILTHLYEKTHLGVLTGSPITDMEIILKAGKAHAKHTEGGDFRQATYRAVRQGLRSAESILLEPVYDFVLSVPSENIGRAMTDITRMGGAFSPPETDGENALLIGTAPVSAMRGYSKEVVQYTRGNGRLSCTLKGYEPCHNADEVIAQLAYDADSDVENTADSVFCSHGAGHTVKWDEVPKHMHLPSILDNSKKESSSSSPDIRDLSRYKSQKDIFALDKELMQIFEQTYGPVRRKVYSEPKRYKTPDYQKQKKRKNLPSDYNGVEYVLVDGYNVIHSWDSLRELVGEHMDTARTLLENTLCNYQGYRKCELILVYDAYKIKGHDREVEKINNITVVYTKEAETADMYIERASYELAKNNRVRVVTSDGMEQLIILGNGAIRVSCREFFEEIQKAEAEIREIISENGER